MGCTSSSEGKHGDTTEGLVCGSGVHLSCLSLNPLYVRVFFVLPSFCSTMNSIFCPFFSMPIVIGEDTSAPKAQPTFGKNLKLNKKVSNSFFPKLKLFVHISSSSSSLGLHYSKCN
jgi:hypothetical protein